MWYRLYKQNTAINAIISFAYSNILNGLFLDIRGLMCEPRKDDEYTEKNYFYFHDFIC